MIHMGGFKGWVFNERTQAGFLKNTHSLTVGKHNLDERWSALNQVSITFASFQPCSYQYGSTCIFIITANMNNMKFT